MEAPYGSRCYKNQKTVPQKRMAVPYGTGTAMKLLVKLRESPTKCNELPCYNACRGHCLGTLIALPWKPMGQ